MKTRTIDSICDYEVINFHDENIIINGSIGKFAKVTIKSGNMIIKGSVESEATISMVDTFKDTNFINNNKINLFFMGGIIINNVSNNGSGKNIGKLTIEGNVEEKAIIEGYREIVVQGDIKRNVKIIGKNCNITAKDIAAGSNLYINTGNIDCRKLEGGATLKSTNGTITCDEVAAGASITTACARIKVKTVGVGASITSQCGRIKITKDASPSADIKSENGIVKLPNINSTKRPMPTSYYNISVSSIFFSGGIILNTNTARIYSPKSSSLNPNKKRF